MHFTKNINLGHETFFLYFLFETEEENVWRIGGV